MNIFTNDDYRRIQAWLKANAIKDSDLVQSETTIPDEDILTIVQKVNGIPTNFKINIKDFLNSSLNKIIIKLFTVNAIKVNNSLVVDIDKIIINEEENLTLQAVFDSFNNQLNDVSSASKGWNIEYQAPSIDEPTVRAKYVLKDYKGVPKGDPIKVYKDSAITNVYLGTTEDTCNENTGEVTKKPVQNNNEALSIVYRLDTGKYSLVNIPIGIFIKEAEFDKYRGLGITENGQVFIKLASDIESSNYLHFNASGELSADGIENRILQDLGTIINSVAGDGTMWGQYKKEEGTKDSPTNEASRWGQYKQAEADRNERLNNLENKFEETEQEIIYDISARNNNAIFESLQALLSSSSLSTLIPTSVRHGGISIRFIQGSVPNSDNKYVQYRLMSDEFTTDTTQWAIADESVYVENPEFIRCYCDADGRLLWWIYKDGSVDWAKGVPAPIQEELRKLEQLIKDNTEGDESVVARVTANETSIVAINEALDKKVDGVYEDSPKYIKVEKDADERVINAITPDGTNYLPKANIDELSLDDGVLDNDAVKSHTYTDSPEFIDVVKDADDRVIEATKNDGTKVLADVETNTLNAKLVVTKGLNISGEDIEVDVISSNKYEDSPEFLKVEKDADGRILSCTNSDGSHYIHNVESETIPTEFSNIDDAENRMEISKDADNRIISYRDSNGKLHENAGIETPIIDAEIVNVDSLTLSKLGLTEFEQALKENGFTGGQGDWSTASSLHIPEPRCAMINITSADGKPYSWPTSKFVNNKVWVEFYDMQGNYFKKRAIHNAQGSSSMRFIKTNGAFDFCNDEWIGDDTFSIKFGDWVYQDSFHAKAYYTDFFKCASIVAYKIADQVEKSRGIFNDRPWKKALLKDYVLGTDQTNSAQIDDLTLQLNNEAKCHPDGFPCIMYLDGAFYGIYAFCLKKHRDNYHMEKDVAEHIHLDGTLYVGYLFGGNINWTAFEIRNPKNLYYKEAQNGTYEYDADVAQAEIAGDDEVNAWIAAGQLPDGTEITSKIKKRLQMTAKVKNYIINFSQRVNQIKFASTTEEKKALFETYFDVDNLVDYEIVQMATGDTDGFGKNWQWTTYDGIKWWVNEYDKDMSFGGHFTGMFTQPAPTTGGWMGSDGNQPIGQLTSLYKTEIISRWKYMVEKGIFSIENFLGLFNDWLDRIGTDNFEKEYKKWSEAPCNRDDKVDTTHWARTNNIEYDSSLANYDNEKTYMPGETCFYDLKDGWSGKFVCVSETTGNPPLTGIYTHAYPSLGYRDNIWRLTNYISQRLEKENEFINNL